MNGPATAFAAKDFRALLPVWAAAAVTMLAEPLLRGTPLGSFPLGMFAYIVGTLALGAHAIGHEYSNRTLPVLFAQPWKRSSMLLTKASVLALMLVALALIASQVMGRDNAREFSLFGRRWQLLLPFAGGLFVAPYLTMKLRSQMAGAVFAASIPGTVWLIALLVGVARYGIETRAADEFAFRVWPPAMFTCVVVGAVSAVTTFMKLEAIEGGREELRLPNWLSIADRNPIRPPLWMLVKKELRLQQMTFAMAALYAGIWLALTVANRINPEFAKDFPIRAVGMLYFALLPLLMGSLASAQERQFGTQDSQAMLPVPFTHQWMVKAGVVLVLALVLGVLLPWTFFAPPQVPSQAFWQLALGILLMTSWCLYLSSLCTSAIVALALALPATAVALVAYRFFEDSVWRLFRGVSKVRAGLLHTEIAVSSAVLAVLIVGAVSVLLYFAAANHRSLERRMHALVRQAAWLLALVAIGSAVMVLVLS